MTYIETEKVELKRLRLFVKLLKQFKGLLKNVSIKFIGPSKNGHWEIIE